MCPHLALAGERLRRRSLRLEPLLLLLPLSLLSLSPGALLCGLLSQMVNNQARRAKMSEHSVTLQ